MPELCLFADCRGSQTTAVAEYPDNVDPNTQISNAPAPFWAEAFPSDSASRWTTSEKADNLTSRRIAV